ncbi:MAG: DNA adenine methylase [Anaerolineales bacterium]|jgi:DNA adenine methylase
MATSSKHTQARPFLKWAGGKRQLLDQMQAYFPKELLNGEISRYAEPFLGSGALFFKIMQSYPIQECLLADINHELILVYKTIQQDVNSLIGSLGVIESQFSQLNQEQRREYYYQIREKYNQQRTSIQIMEFEPNWIQRAAYMIFLNRTGFNGLFRVNSSGEFNVPYGRYEHPRILDRENLHLVAALLQRVCLDYGDFEAIADFVNEQTLVYFDPPYRPLSPTAHFTSYSTGRFGDQQQLRLARFYRSLDGQGGRLMLSNSDPHNVDPSDNFFERAYRGFYIKRLKARRNINRDAEKRGQISELLILNYDPGT